MRRNPMYAFKDRSQIGIYNVPLHSTIHIITDGTSPRMVEIISKNGINGSSTIGDFLDNPNLYTDLMTTSDGSELQKIEEGGNTGWRMLGVNPQNYTDIGSNAIDMSFSNTDTDSKGVGSKYGFATGFNTSVRGEAGSAFGTETVAKNTNSFVFGKYNVGSASNTILEVGIGSDEYTKRNALEITTTGSIVAPELTLSLINNSPSTVLVTKEYSDIVDGGYIV